jgi:hypothetical protein
MTPEEAEIRLNVALARLKRIGAKFHPLENGKDASDGQMANAKDRPLSRWFARFWNKK